MNFQRGNSQQIGSSRALAVARAIYDEVNLALWAIAAALIIFVVVFILPKAPELRARADLLRTQQVGAENEWYCQRWHMGPMSPMHERCMMDLQQLRISIESRIADDSGI
jgi:hypothetical protein